ncbi:MlaE family ABC transporter permease [Nocardioides sp. GCM10030258]|uniref:MlaE family ABC transporter permease n=1 Tax=unclassified Nocardioides TaxID=2615069 RepID=UPI00361628A2
MSTLSVISRGARPIGDFIGFTLDTFVAMFTTRLQWREFVQQCWFVTSVSLGPAILLAIPFVALVTYQFNNVLVEIGAIDLSGSGAAFGTVTQIGPVATTFVIAGASSTAICADIGARKIREELDAMEVLGIDPIQRLVVPRVLATAVNAFFLNSVMILIGLSGGYIFAVFLQDASPGQFVDSMTLLVGFPDLVHGELRAVVFGVIGSLIGCYRGMTCGGGSQGVGNAVNETVVFTFMALFPVNILLTQIPYSLGLL